MDLTIDVDQLYLNNIPFKKPEFSFSKRNGLYNEPKLQKSSSEYKQMEIDQFRFNLPSVK